MTKKLEINFTKKPEIVFQFDQFLNVEQAVDKFLNKKENLNKLIAPLIPTNIEETIQKLIPEVSDGYTPQKGVDYDDGKDGETPSDEKIISLIKPQIPKVIPWKDGTTPKKGIDYFTKQELNEIKKELKTTILSEMPEHATKEEVNIKITEVLDKIRKLPTWGGGAQFLRQLMDVNVGNPTAQQYGLTYNPSRSEFALTAITGGGGGGSVDSVVAWNGIDVDATDPANPIVAVDETELTHNSLGGLQGGTSGQYNHLTDAQVSQLHAPVTVSDTSEIDLTLTGQQISASIVAWSIDETKLDTSVNASLDLADTAVQPAGLSGYELLSNKSTDTTLGTSNSLYPSQLAVKTYVDNSVVGLLDDRGNYDASVNTFPSNGGSGTAGAILKWDSWYINVAGTLGGVPVVSGDNLRALVDTPWQTASNWSVLEGNIGYVPENVANKENTTIDTSTTKYPTVNLLKTGLDTKQATLVSGTNIKTVNSTTLLGSGDLAVATTAQGALADTALQPANISDTAYDATSWNGVTTIAPSKNAVRDKIETMDSAIALNTAKVTNATHSGDMTGDTALTAQPAIITGKASATVASGDLLLIADVNDSNNLKQVTAQSIADLWWASGATTALDNLASVAINTSLVSDTDNTDDLGTTLKKWANLFVTTIGATATRVTKGWFTDLEVTNAIAGSITGNAATVTTNANLTGDVTSTGNVTTIANSAVTLAKMANLAQDQFIGRTTASTGVPETATITAAARTVLDDTTVGAMVDTLWGATSTGTGGLVRATAPTITLTNATWLPTAGLVDDAVTLAKMAAGTAWNLITYDASGNPAAVATWTATHILTSNGAGAAPTFQAAAAGGSATAVDSDESTFYTYNLNTLGYYAGNSNGDIIGWASSGLDTSGSKFTGDKAEFKSSSSTAYMRLPLYTPVASTDPSFTWALGKDIHISFLASHTSTGNKRWGLSDANTSSWYDTTNVSHMALIQYDGTNISSVTGDGSAKTVTTLSGVTGTHFNLYRIVVNPWVDVKFYVNGVLKNTHTTNLPTTGVVHIGMGTNTSARFIYMCGIKIAQQI